MPFIGETAGLLTSVFIAVNAVISTKAGARLGSVTLNRSRVVFALVYLVILNLVLFRQPLPFSAELTRWKWLSLSGLIGLAIGDVFLFQAYLMIGPRLGSLLLSLSTVFGALEAWLFFGESLRPGQILGIAVTLVGMVWVILERAPRSAAPGTGLPSAALASEAQPAHHVSALGVFFGVLAGLGQGTGLVFSRQGMQGSFSPISGNVIRMLTAVLALWAVAALQRQAGSTIRALRADPRAVRLVALAAFIGPVIGVSLSLLAVQNIPVGVASVLTSLSPIFMLPFSHFFFKEQLGWQPIAGTFLAMIGVVVLFLT